MTRGLFFRWSKGVQLKKASRFLTELERSTALNISEFVCHVYHIAEELDDAKGWDFFNPEQFMANNPRGWKEVGALIKTKQKMKDFYSANALYIWDVTILGAADRDFRPIAKAMWSELARGFDGASMMADHYMEQTGIKPRIDRLGEMPRGLI